MHRAWAWTRCGPTTPRFPSGYEITIRGFRERTGIDALEWAKRAEDLGVGEIVVNSVDADGTRDGFELNLTRMISTSVGIPVVASGGAGTPQHLVDVFNEGQADAAIIASMIHTGEYTIAQIKDDWSRRSPHAEEVVGGVSDPVGAE